MRELLAIVVAVIGTAAITAMAAGLAAYIRACRTPDS